MTKRTKASPTLQLSISDAQYLRAKRSDSGGCLIADAIKEQYPHLSSVFVDMATVRVTDRVKGVRYTYLTPETAQYCLLAFDQGWTNPFNSVTIRNAVKITPITATPSRVARSAEQRAVRIAELEAKQDQGEKLTGAERKALTRMRNHKPVERPSSVGPAEVLSTSEGHAPVIVGGQPLVQGRGHPNLLRSRRRFYGAKVSQPGMAFQEAVDEAVALRFAELPLEEGVQP